MKRVVRRLLAVFAAAFLAPACGPPPPPKPPPPPPPSMPTALTLSPTSTGMGLTWQNGALPQTAVSVERSIDDVRFSIAATLSGTSQSYQDPGLFPGTTYYYKVRAFNGPTPGPYSLTKSTITPAPAWLQLSPGPPTPMGRANMGVTNALVSNQMVIAAGDDGTPSNTQTWTFRYSGTGSPAWSQQGLGTNPGIRSNPGVAYDPVSHAVYLVGGEDQSGIGVFKSDVWKMTGTQGPPGVWTWAWAPVPTVGNGPPGLLGHSVVMQGTLLYVFGGQNANSSNNLMNDLWILDFGAPTPTWSHPLAAAPIDPRVFHAAILDSVNNQMVVFGGFDGLNYRNDSWALDLSSLNWAPITPIGLVPSGRSNMSTVYYAGAQMLIMFGGYSPTSNNDLWMLSLSGSPSWHPVVTSGTTPGIRGGHGAIFFVEALGKMILFGGYDPGLNKIYPDIWQLQF